MTECERSDVLDAPPLLAATASHERPVRESADAWATRISHHVADNDRDALAELYEARYAMLLAFTRARTGRGDDFACDVVHDAWLRILRRMPRFANVATLDAWLTRVVLSAAIDRLKSERARGASDTR